MLLRVTASHSLLMRSLGLLQLLFGLDEALCRYDQLVLETFILISKLVDLQLMLCQLI